MWLPLEVRGEEDARTLAWMQRKAGKQKIGLNKN